MNWIADLWSKLGPDTKAGVLLGVLISLVIGGFYFLVDKLLSDLWYRLPFRIGRHRALLEGTAMRIHELSGLHRVGAEDAPISLSQFFPKPEGHDAIDFQLRDYEIRTKYNKDARLTGLLRYQRMGRPWAARVTGRGRYFPKRDRDLSGYIYLVCDIEGHEEGGPGNESWQCAYILRTSVDRTGRWDGLWFMFDSELSQHGKMGTMSLQPVKW